VRLSIRPRRRGAHAVEFAIVAPLVLVLLIGLVVCAVAISDYQQTASLAREAARFAAVHAGYYQKDNASAINQGALPNVTSSYIATNVVQGRAVNLDPSQLQVTVKFNTSAGSFDWDDTANNGNRWPYSTTKVNGTTYNETNTVSVTVTYTYSPAWFLSGSIRLTSTAVVPVCY
jgi:Flp pilus assembly protein TadG